MGATVLRNSGGPVPSRHLFAVSVENRNAETLRAIIARHVLPGSIVRTDLWRGYRALTDFGLEHETVNHMEHFVDLITGVHRNTIEGTWNGINTTYVLFL